MAVPVRTLPDPDRLFVRGAQLRRQSMGTPSATRPAPPTEAERAFHRIIGEYDWGATWMRPGLDLPSRCLYTMTCLVALGREGSLRSHIRGALHLGFTHEQVIEVLPHLTLYERCVCAWVGYPLSRCARPHATGERLPPVPIAEARPWVMRGTQPNGWTTMGRWCPVRLDGGHDPLGLRRAALSYEEAEHGRGRISP